MIKSDTKNGLNFKGQYLEVEKDDISIFGSDIFECGIYDLIWSSNDSEWWHLSPSYSATHFWNLRGLYKILFE